MADSYSSPNEYIGHHLAFNELQIGDKIYELVFDSSNNLQHFSSFVIKDVKQGENGGILFKKDEGMYLMVDQNNLDKFYFDYIEKLFENDFFGRTLRFSCPRHCYDYMLDLKKQAYYAYETTANIVYDACDKVFSDFNES